MSTGSASKTGDLLAAARALTVEQLDGLPADEQDRLIALFRAASRAARPQAVVPPGPQPELSVVAALVAGVPVARRLVVDGESDEWSLQVLSVRHSVESEELPRFPTASEYKRWSDEKIAALRLDPEDWAASIVERDPFDLEADELRAIDGADDEPLDVHPFNPAVERLEQAQAELRRAEATRVRAAVSAWRVAVAANTADAEPGGAGLFRAAVMMQLAHSMQIAESTASALVHTAETLERDLPESWRRFVAGDVPWRRMQQAHAAVDGLDAEFLPEFDAKAARILTTSAAPRVKQRLHELRERLQATTAVDRHERALAARHVEIDPLPDGMVALTNVMPAAEGILIRGGLHEQAVAAAAISGESRTVAQIESDLLTDYWSQGIHTVAPDGVPDMTVLSRRPATAKVCLLIPAMTALGHGNTPAILDGYGPIDIETAKRLAGGATSWVKVLTDPVTGAVLNIGRDKYQPTADMRTLLGLLDRGNRGPNTAVPPGRTEADHVTPFRQHFARGKTAIDNLVLLARRDHAVKTAGYFDIELRDDRTLVWTSWAGTRIIATVDPPEPTPIPPD